MKGKCPESAYADQSRGKTMTEKYKTPSDLVYVMHLILAFLFQKKKLQMYKYRLNPRKRSPSPPPPPPKKKKRGMKIGGV